MERAGHRRSKSVSSVEGIRDIQKQSVPLKLSSDSLSYAAGSTGDDELMLEMGQSSSKRASGTPMKKLLAEEMSKEVAPRRKSSGVIARLIGFEGLLSPLHIHKDKGFSDTHRYKSVSINMKTDSRIYDVSNRRSIEQQQCKDVSDGFETSHITSHRFSSRWSASSILTRPEMALIRKKNSDAKHLSTDEKLQDSEEVEEAVEPKDSNKDLLLNLFRHPDSLFLKHLRGVRTNPAALRGSRAAVLKPLNPIKSEDKDHAWKSEREISREYDETSHPKRRDGLLLEARNHHRDHSSCRSSKIQPEEKNEDEINSTSIVLLRPITEKTVTAGVSGSSPNHPCLYEPDYEKMKEHLSDVGAETVSRRTDDAPYGVELLKPISKEAREIARKVTRRLKDACDDSLDAKVITGFRGSAGDKSLYDDNGSDLDAVKLSSRKSDRANKLNRYSSSGSAESLINSEARKRMSERWSITKKYQDLEIVVKTTLGEMLALTDKETRTKDFDNKISLGRESGRLSSKNGDAPRSSPLRIRTSEGRKDEKETTSSRSRSSSIVPTVDGRSHRRSGYHHDELSEEKLCVRRSGSKVPEENVSQKDDFSSKDPKPRNKKPLPNESGSSSEAKLQIQMKERVKDLTEEREVFHIVMKDETADGPVYDFMMVAEHGSTSLSSRSSILLPKNSSPPVVGERSAAPDQKLSTIQELHNKPAAKVSPFFRCFGVEPDSSGSSKEADNPTPVSVVGVPFTNDTLSSEIFETVGAELHELKIQLQLLKMESDTSPELSHLVPIDEEAPQLSPIFSEGNYNEGSYNQEDEDWVISYAVDLLINSGFEESGFNMFKTEWHSPSHPLDPKLFEDLEKKYGNETTMSFSKRKLLFDSINSSLVEIFEEQVDPCPWVMLKLSGSKSTLPRECIIDAIDKLIKQGFRDEEAMDKGFEKEMELSFTKGDIDVIGMEIEQLMIDEMIIEVCYN